METIGINLDDKVIVVDDRTNAEYEPILHPDPILGKIYLEIETPEPK